MLDKILNLKRNHAFYLIITVAIFLYLTGCKAPSPQDLTAKDPEVRENTALKIIKAKEKSLKIEETEILELLNVLKDKSKNVRLATLKVLKVAKKESTIPEVVKLFRDKEEDVREKAIEAVANFGETSSKYVTEFIFFMDKQEDLTEVEKDYMEECSVIVLIKIGEFEPILDQAVKLKPIFKDRATKLIKIAEDYYENEGDKEGLEKIASYHSENGNYEDAAILYEKLGKAKEGYQKIADFAFKQMDYETAALFYEKLGDKEKAAESRRRIIQDGQWTGNKIKFTVSSKGRKITYMEVTIPWRGGRTTNYIRKPIEIKNSSFSYHESRYNGFVKVEGKFTSAEKAAGSASFSQTQSGPYGQQLRMSGSINWSANFKK